MKDDNASFESPEVIFARAAERAKQMGLPYAGAVTPAEAHRLREAGAAEILDVRTPPEYTQVGHVPGTPLIVWPRGGEPDALAEFLAEVREKYEDTERPLLLLCRSGSRSHYAAHLLTHNGYKRAYNVLEGFEGQQGAGNGWRAAGLPWEQGN